MGRPWARTALVWLLLAGGCRSGARAPQARVDDAGAPTLAVPVKVARATRQDVPVIVSGPGRTESSETQVVRAPFAGMLLDLVVSDGDQVRGGQALGWIVSRDSEAALEGARAMLASATTRAQREAATRALALAQRGLVKTTLRAPENGIVLSHQADEDARLDANQSVVVIVATDAIVFMANIAQVDLDAIRPGQPATIALAAAARPLRATVHAVLPGGSATDSHGADPARLRPGRATVRDQSVRGRAHHGGKASGGAGGAEGGRAARRCDGDIPRGSRGCHGPCPLGDGRGRARRRRLGGASVLAHPARHARGGRGPGRAPAGGARTGGAMTFVERMRRRQGAAFLIAGIVALAGAIAASRLPSSIFPSVTFPLVKVIADVGEEPAARMMPTVTRPLEEAALRVPGVHLVRSTTSRGSCELTAEFHWGTNMQVALARVQAEAERVRPTLPPETRLDIEWMNPAVFPILGYALTSDDKTQAELRTLAEYTLKPEAHPHPRGRSGADPGRPPTRDRGAARPCFPAWTRSWRGRGHSGHPRRRPGAVRRPP